VTTRTRRGALRARIIAWSFIPTALIMAAVVLVNFQAYSQVTEDLVVQRNREVARLQAGQLEADLDDMTKLLEAVSRRLGLSSGSQRTWQSILEDSGELLATFDGGLIVLDTTGMVVAASPERAGDVKANWVDTPLFKQMTFLSRARPVFSDLLPLGPQGELVLACAVPITTARDQFQGILAGLIRMQPEPENAFYRMIAHNRLEARGTAYLLDGNGRVIYHSQPENIGVDYSSRDIVRQALAGKTGSLRTVDEDGEAVVASYAPVSNRWGLVTQESWATLTSQSQKYRYFLLILLVLGVVTPAIVVTQGVRRMLKPITDLTQAAQEVAGGQFGRTIDAPTGDEIEDLAEQFNRMSLQLQESYTNLEQRVADRTRELATLNTIASVTNQSLDLQKTLESALEETRKCMAMDVGIVYLKEEGAMLSLAVAAGFSPDFVDRYRQLPLEGTAAGQAAMTRRPATRQIKDYSPGELRRALEREALAMVVSIPLQIKEQVLGVMNLCSRTPRELKAEEVDMLASIGKQVGVAIENAQLYEQAENTAAQAERNRLARELHDAVSQTLFSASLIAEVLPKLWERDAELGRRNLDDLRLLTRGALAEMRSLLVELRPAALIETDLSSLMRQLSESVTGRTRLPVKLDLHLEAELPDEVKVAFYRIAQEGLNNVIKHAEAQTVELALCTRPGEAELTIKDDGRGFDPEQLLPGHFGLAILRERAEAIGAHLVIESRPGAGTILTLRWRSAVEVEER
jgi:nitrate/nitrite-specific signal transduction histidine kinase